MLIIPTIQNNTQVAFTPLISFPIYLITLGYVYVLISCLGFWVTIRDSFCFTMSYVVSVLVLIILLIASKSYIEHLETAMGDVIEKTCTMLKAPKNGVLDRLQHLNGSEDYEISGIRRLFANFCYGSCTDICGGFHRKFVFWISCIALIFRHIGVGLIVVDLIVIAIGINVPNNIHVK